MRCASLRRPPPNTTSPHHTTLYSFKLNPFSHICAYHTAAFVYTFSFYIISREREKVNSEARNVCETRNGGMLRSWILIFIFNVVYVKLNSSRSHTLPSLSLSTSSSFCCNPSSERWRIFFCFPPSSCSLHFFALNSSLSAYKNIWKLFEHVDEFFSLLTWKFHN